jgi:dTDP-4-amino-4,6-dideoxygalactose transaminase
MSSSAWKRYTKEGSANWELVYPGFKYNMTDIEASLGIQQLKKIETITELRTRWAELYKKLLSGVEEVEFLGSIPNIRHAWHLFIISLKIESLRITRDEFMQHMKAENIGVGLHFIPVHKQPYYQKLFGFRDKDFPVASHFSDRILSLPLFPQMEQRDIEDTVAAVKKIIKNTKR